MKLKSVVALVTAISMLAACGRPLTTTSPATNKVVTYPTYGLLNEDANKSDNMCYSISAGNVIWSVLLIETVIAPVYFIGFSLFNPTHPKDPEKGCKEF